MWQIQRRPGRGCCSDGFSRSPPGFFRPGTLLAGHIANQVTWLYQSFPDAQITLNEVIAEGDWVAIYQTVLGTNTGPYFGRPPTGKQVSGRAMSFYKIVDGKIISCVNVADHLSFMQQLVMFTMPGAAQD